MVFDYDEVINERVSGLAWFSLTNASICDFEGNLLFYTNGCSLFDANHNVVADGDRLYDGENWVLDQFCYLGFNLPQGAIIIPSPVFQNQYLLFHMNARYVKTPNNGILLSDTLYCTTINVQNDGSVTIAKKAEPIILDTIELGHLSAIQRSNKKDWWLMVPKRNGEEYFILDISIDGIKTNSQKIGPRFTFENTWVGQSKFTPNSKNYIRYSPKDGIHIFDFDLSSGALSNPRSLINWKSDYKDETFGGMSISPNSELLYLSTIEGLYQTPINSIINPDSLLLIDTFNGTQCPFFDANFFQSELGPDGRIYISASGGCRYLHVIQQPDKRGKTCEFEQSAIKLVTYNSYTIPNFPVFYDSTLHQDMEIDTKECSIEGHIEDATLIIHSNCCVPELVNFWSTDGKLLQQLSTVLRRDDDKYELEMPESFPHTSMIVQAICGTRQYSFIIVNLPRL